MLVAAFAAAAAAAVTGSAWAGLAAGIVASVLVGLAHGFACITHHGNQVVSGMALNITMSGLTAVLGYAWFREGGQTPLLGARRSLCAHRPCRESTTLARVAGPRPRLR